MVAVPSGYRSAAVRAMVAVLGEVGEQWVSERVGGRERVAATVG